MQCVGRSGGSRQYRRKRASLHSCAPSSAPFTVDGFTISQTPVFVSRCSQRACRIEAPSSATVSASSACCCPHCQTAVHPSRRQAEWSAVRKSTWPLSDVTRCPVMTQDAFQFSGAVWYWSGTANPACLSVRWATPLSGKPLPIPSNNDGTKVSLSAVSTGWKASPMPRLTH